MSELWPLVMVAAVAALPGVVVPCVFWVMHAALHRRVARLEAQQRSQMTHGDAIRIYERLSGLESKVETVTTGLTTIQDYLRKKHA